MVKTITSEKPLLNRRADLDRESLFAALEMFVNAGDSIDDLRRFRSQHREFFPENFYRQSEQLAVAGKDTFFNWYKHQLQTVWRRNDTAGIRLAVLLGLRDVNYVGPPGGDFETEVSQHMQILHDAVKQRYGENATVPSGDLGAHLFGAHVVPNWQDCEFSYRWTTQFHLAVYELMRNSWRAKLCQRCGKYMVAAKAHNTYCSVSCSGAVKRKRDLEHWRDKGKAAREARIRRIKKGKKAQQGGKRK